jgi:progesterone-induced-blocking factor 1
MAADATAKARLERLLGELDKSAETPAGEDVDGGDYPISEYSSMSDVTESDADEGRRAKRAAAQPGGAHAGRLEQKVQARTSKLEERIAQLVEENARKDASRAAALAAKEREFEVERAKMLEAVSLLKNKQNELERLAPPLREAVQNAKEQLRAVVCSQEKLAELQAKDPAALSLQEFTILRVHQETANLRAELDVCRVERDSARETSGRFEADAARLTRELRQAREHVARADSDADAERAALDSRCSRLARELEDAMVKVEVLSAKGAMYDEVAATVGPPRQARRRGGARARRRARRRGRGGARSATRFPRNWPAVATRWSCCSRTRRTCRARWRRRASASASARRRRTACARRCARCARRATTCARRFSAATPRCARSTRSV